MLRNRSSKLYRLRWLVLIAALGAQAACTKSDNGELQWARAALERNPQIKVLSIDAEKNTIQVRVKITGEMLTVTPGELAAMPIADLIALTNAPHAATIATPVTASPPAEPASTVAAAQPTMETPAAVAQVKPEYKVEREDGRIRVTGPGVSIESPKAVAPKSAAVVVQQFDEPIVCDGKRMLHLDNRRINVDGDAVVARGGCELHITNSQITATGTAVTALDAIVHIANSELQGNDGSLTASSAAHIFLNNNKFTGLARRDPLASIQDQGSNIWR